MRSTILALVIAVSVLLSGCITSQIRRDPVTPFETSQAIQRLVESTELNAVVADAARATLEASPEANLTLQQMWGTVIDTNDPARSHMGHWQGGERVYPASVIKVAFMVHVFEQVRTGELDWDKDLVENLRAMIRVSSNVATQNIVDMLSGVQDGPRLEGRAYENWAYHREMTNRYLRSLGFNQMNANQKTWDQLPAENSLELQFLGDSAPMGFSNGNRMTTNETAAMMWAIDEGLIVSGGACEQMRRLLLRRGTDAPGDALGPIAQGMPIGSSTWTKDGSTDRFRHDAATILLPDGRRYTLALFTELNWREGLDRNALIARWAREIIDRLPH